MGIGPWVGVCMTASMTGVGVPYGEGIQGVVKAILLVISDPNEHPIGAAPPAPKRRVLQDVDPQSREPGVLKPEEERLRAEMTPATDALVLIVPATGRVTVPARYLSKINQASLDGVAATGVQGSAACNCAGGRPRPFMASTPDTPRPDPR